MPAWSRCRIVSPISPPRNASVAPSATMAITEIAYATGPVSDVTRVVSGPSHGRFVPVSAAKAPLEPATAMNATIRATRRVPGRFAKKIRTRFISFLQCPPAHRYANDFRPPRPGQALPRQLGNKALILASKDSDHPDIQ